MWDGMNNRKFPRAKCRCTIKLFQTAGGEPISAFTENIGAGGICLILDKGLDVFAPVELELSLPTLKDPLRCNGSVVWVVRKQCAKDTFVYDTGIEFSDMKPSDKAQLKEFVEKVPLR
jgi:c-di-GMP-binding flagellar brake protein YcgR